MPWRGPSYKGEFPSLGRVLCDWYAEHLKVPSGPKAGEALVLTAEQASFVIRFYRLHIRDGSRYYRRGMLRRPKGWGKSPLLAAMAIGELAGPVVFGGWDGDGEPVGMEHRSPWVQIAACSEDQTDNTYVALFEMLRNSQAPDALGLDVGLTRIFLKGRSGRLEPVTASSGSREGQPVTFGVLDETHLWLPNNGGRRLAATIRRNVAKMDGSSVESTNAYAPGQLSVAEETEQVTGPKRRGVLIDVGAPVADIRDFSDKRATMARLRIAYGDSDWVDLVRQYAEMTDPNTDPADARRYNLNQIVKGSEQAFDTDQWARLANPQTVVADKDLIVIGFDGARYHDATGIIATQIETGYQWKAGLWENDGSEGWEVPLSEVEAVMEQLFESFEVWRLYADPWYWETQVNSEWPARWGEKVIAWDTRSRKPMAYAVRRFVAALRAGELSHDGDSDYARHIANARRRETQMLDEEGRKLWVIQKEHSSSPNKIDAAMAGILSWEARGDAIAAGATKSKPGGFYAFS